MIARICISRDISYGCASRDCFRRIDSGKVSALNTREVGFQVSRK